MAKVVVLWWLNGEGACLSTLFSLAEIFFSYLFPSKLLCLTFLPCSATLWRLLLRIEGCLAKYQWHSLIECHHSISPVLHFAPGSVSQLPKCKALCRTLYLFYSAFFAKHSRTIHCSSPSAMPPTTFANESVSNALQTYPPQYMSLAAHSRLLSILEVASEELGFVSSMEKNFHDFHLTVFTISYSGISLTHDVKDWYQPPIYLQFEYTHLK